MCPPAPQALAENFTIEDLDLSKNPLKAEGCAALAALLDLDACKAQARRLQAEAEWEVEAADKAAEMTPFRFEKEVKRGSRSMKDHAR